MMDKMNIASFVLDQHYSQHDISELLGKAEDLGYAKTGESGNWQLYARGQQFLAAGLKEGRKERYALVQGNIHVETAIPDLKEMEKGMLKSGSWWYNTFLRLPFMDRLERWSLSAGGIGSVAGAIVVGITASPAAALAGMVVGTPIGLLVGEHAGFIIGQAHDRKVIRNLSYDALSYNYGSRAEKAILTEHAELLQQQKRGQLYDTIASGVLPRDALVKNTSVAIANGV